MLLLAACAAPGESTPAKECEPPGVVEVAGDLIPGATVQLHAAGAETWTVGDTTLSGEDVSWEVPDLAVNAAEAVEVTASACGEEVSTTLTVDYPVGYRTILVYDPAVIGSLEVAAAYQAFRDVPGENLCPVSATNTVEIAAKEFSTWLDSVMDCVKPHTQAIVPVWGVPYRVSGQIIEPYAGVATSVALDALLFYGADAHEITSWTDNPLYRDGDSMAGEYKEWVPIGERRERVTVYLVSRIEGVDADAAIELVERTELAEQTELDGIVYVDGNRGDTPPATDQMGSYEAGEWNMWGTRYLFEDLAWYPVVWDGNAEEFGTEPAPTDCPDALYYAGWYSYGNYNDCFTWTVGAIGGHLDSYSAGTPRGEGSWAGEALMDGITATFGAVNEPYVAGMPEYDQFFLYLTQGASFAEAGYESTILGSWMMMWIGDPWYRPYPVD